MKGSKMWRMLLDGAVLNVDEAAAAVVAVADRLDGWLAWSSRMAMSFRGPRAEIMGKKPITHDRRVDPTSIRTVQLLGFRGLRGIRNGFR